MSMKAPPTLLQLAGQSLLRNEVLAISALEKLPMELFPPLFMEAFTRRCTGIVKAMVQAWPFPCLPLGALMKTRDVVTLQVALDGLDMLLGQQVRPRRWKLQVLDLRNVHLKFWKIWSGNMANACSTEAKSKKKKQPTEQNGPRMGEKQPLMVLVDVCLKQSILDAFLSYLLLWVQERKGLLQLGCRKLKISTVHIQSIRKVLEVLQLDWMQEVQVNCTWQLSTLAAFAPYLGQMRNLLKLLLSHIEVPASISPEEQKPLVEQFTSQLLNLACLQELSLDSVSFLEGHLDQVLRCLRTPLEALSMTDCQLAESDLKHLSQCPSICQLKHLNLSGVTLTRFSPEPLRVLLERVSDTLKTLDLEDCGIRDSQLTALLPALSRCYQLTTFNYLRNPMSVAVLEKLLCHTIQLGHLSLEMYSTPLEVYGVHGAHYRRRLGQLRDELALIVKPLKHPRTVWFSTIPCPLCGNQALYEPGPNQCRGCSSI